MFFYWEPLRDNLHKLGRKEVLRVMPRGKVKWFNNKKGFGFIVTDAGKDIFVHYSKIQGDGYKTLKEGDTVDYEVGETDKGPQAENVCKVV